jgi:perosamine synthetase
MRRENSAYLTDRIRRETAAVKTPSPPDGYFHLFQMFTVRTDHRDGLMNHLSAKGIMSILYFPPVHQSHFYREVLKMRCSLPVTERLAGDSLTLPMYPSLTRDEMDLMAREIGSFFRTVKA